MEFDNITYNNALISGLSLTAQPTVSGAGVPASAGLEQMTVSGSFTDLQENYSHTATISWGDGSSSAVQIPAGETTFTASPHSYSSSSYGTHSISVTITGLDGVLSGSTTGSDSGAYMDDEGNVYVDGVSGTNNTATISQDSTTGDLSVTLNGGTPAVFSAAADVFVYMKNGNNTINAAGVNLPMTFFGGSGSDTFTGGDGGNLIYGGTAGGNTLTAGAGDDTIYGDGSAANTIYGGTGNDTITGGSGSDHITGGSGNSTIYSGAGYETITCLSGNNEIYGGAGGDSISCSGQNNWIQCDSGSNSVDTYGGNDWIYGGSGSNDIYAAGDNEVIHGGSGTNHITGGTGTNKIFGGTGTNFITSYGANDVIQGGSAGNYIYHSSSYYPGLAASIEVKDSNNNPTFDGTIKANGTAYLGDDQELSGADPGYGGIWTFNDLDSGSRLGEDSVTPMAVYATWNTSGLTLPSGKSWATDAVYTVSEVTSGGASTTLGYLSVGSQTTAPLSQSPITGDRPWLRLGVWNVTVGDTLTVMLRAASGEELCVGDVMIHAIWPTVSIRPTNVTLNTKVPTANAGDYVDWVDAWQRIQASIDGQGSRIALQIVASIESLYYQISTATANDWLAILQSVTGVDFWNSAKGGSQLTQDGSGNLIDQSLTSAGKYACTVYASSDPDGPVAIDIPCAAEAKDEVIAAKDVAGVQVVNSGIVTAMAVTDGSIADQDQKWINVPPGQKQGPYVMGALRWQAQYTKAFTDQKVDPSTVKAVANPKETFPLAADNPFAKNYTVYYWRFKPNAAAASHFLASRPYALAFDYIEKPGLTFTFQIDETQELHYGTPNRYKPDGVDWGEPITKTENKVPAGTAPLEATNDKVRQEFTNLTWGYLKLAGPGAPAERRVVLTDAPSLSGLWDNNGNGAVGQGANRTSDYVWQHTVLTAIMSDGAGISKTYRFTFDLVRRPDHPDNPVTFVGKLTQVVKRQNG